jgi:hypothetical protein
MPIHRQAMKITKVGSNSARNAWLWSTAHDATLLFAATLMS